MHEGWVYGALHSVDYLIRFKGDGNELIESFWQFETPVSKHNILHNNIIRTSNILARKDL